MAQTVENPPAMQETQVQSLGLEDTLEKGMATHSQYSCLENPWTEEPGWANTQRIGHGHRELDMTERLTHSFSIKLILYFLAAARSLWDLSSPTRN